MTREPIYAALFALLAATPGIRTASRRLKHWTDVADADMPALFVAQAGEVVTRPPGLPPKWELLADVHLYVRQDQGSSTLPQQIVNPFLDAICATLDPAPALPRQTLGGLVHHTRVEGEIATDRGMLGEISVAIIPVRILVP